jgi:HAD superfamily hydrolase (TIGR01484 family)
MIKILFLDIDGTLIFKENCSNCIKISGEDYFIHKSTQSLLNRIKRIIPIILISGRRKSSYFRVKKFIPHNVAILEHGGLIYNDDLIYNKWKKVLAYHCGEKESLWNFTDELMKKGFYIDKKERKISFRVQSTKFNKILPKNLEEKIIEFLPKNLKIIKNEKMVDIIPINSGKLNVALFYLQEKGVNINDVAFIGNDENDIDFLSAVGKAMTFQSSSRSVILSVRKKGKFGIVISEGHNGIINALKKIKQDLKIIIK